MLAVRSFLGPRVTKPRPISSVHVDIARFAWEVSQVEKAGLSDWLLRLTKCLATRDPTIHEYGAHLLAEVDEFRKADSERKRVKYSVDSLESVDSPESPPRSDQIRSDQIKGEEKSKSVRAPRFTPPTLEAITEYCRERGKGVEPQRWMDHYESNGWKVGRNSMKDWKAAVRNWEKGVQNGTNGKHPQQFKSAQEKREDRIRDAIGSLKRPGGGDQGPDYQDVFVMPEGRTSIGRSGI